MPPGGRPFERREQCSAANRPCQEKTTTDSVFFLERPKMLCGLGEWAASPGVLPSTRLEFASPSTLTDVVSFTRLISGHISVGSEQGTAN